MRLLNVTANYISKKTADHAGIFIHRQSLALKKMDCDIQVINAQPFLTRRMFSLQYPIRSEHDEIIVNRPRFLHIPLLIKPGKILDMFYSLAVLRMAKTIFKTWKPDIVVCDWIVPCGFAGYKISKELDIPLVLRARGGDIRIIKKQLPDLAKYYRQIGEQAKIIFCMGHGLYEDLIRVDIFDKEKLYVTSNGIDTKIFHPADQDERTRARQSLGIPQDAQVWVFIGSWDVQKGSTVLSLVLPKLLNQMSKVYFLVAGPVRDRVGHHVIQSIGDRVRFVGLVKNEKVINCLHAADLFLLPSLAEGLPNALLEAMACGVPVIASAVGGIPHLIVDGKNGILVEPNNISSLEENIKRCATDREYRERLGLEAWQTIIQGDFDLEIVAGQVCKRFQECINTFDNINQFEK